MSAAASAEGEGLLGDSRSSGGGDGSGGSDIAHGVGAGVGVDAGSGEAAERQDGLPRPWLGRRSVKRWRPEEETSATSPEDGGGEPGVGGSVPAAMRLGRRRWKG